MLSKKNKKLVVKKIKTQHRKKSSKQNKLKSQKKINLRFTKLIKNYRNKQLFSLFVDEIKQAQQSYANSIGVDYILFDKIKVGNKFKIMFLNDIEKKI